MEPQRRAKHHPQHHLLERLADTERRFKELDALLANPEVLGDPDRLRDLGRERSHIEATVRVGDELRTALEQARDARELIAGEDDPEMVALAQEELEAAEGRIPSLAEEVRELLIPRDPMDDRPAVVEIRAGTGGDEAGLFAADLFRRTHGVEDRAPGRVGGDSRGVQGGHLRRPG